MSTVLGCDWGKRDVMVVFNPGFGVSFYEAMEVSFRNTEDDARAIALALERASWLDSMRPYPEFMPVSPAIMRGMRALARKGYTPPKRPPGRFAYYQGAF